MIVITAPTRPVPLLINVEGENLALLPALPRHVGEHPQQPLIITLGDKCRMIQGVNQFAQPGHPEAVVPGKERLGHSPVGGLPRTNLHQMNVTAKQKDTMARLVQSGLSARARRLANAPRAA